jgi:hypothetical protein
VDECEIIEDSNGFSLFLEGICESEARLLLLLLFLPLFAESELAVVVEVVVLFDARFFKKINAIKSMKLSSV